MQAALWLERVEAQGDELASALDRGPAGILGPVGCLLRLGTNAFLAAYSSESPSSKVSL